MIDSGGDIGVDAVRRSMSSKSSHGTFRNSRNGGFGLGFLVIAGVIAAVILVGMIAISTAVLKLRDDLKAYKSEQAGSGPAVASSGISEELFTETVQELRAEISDLQRSEFASDDAQKALKEIVKGLAVLLHQHDRDEESLLPLLSALSPDEKRKFLLHLAGEDPKGGHTALRKEIASVSSNNPVTGTEPLPSELPTHVEGETPLPGPGTGPDEGTPGVTPGPGPIISNPNGTSTEENDPEEDNRDPENENENENENETEENPGENVPAPPTGTKLVDYTVKSGDTLSRIARNHGTTAEEIQKANGISNPNRIRVGLVLKVPVDE